MRKKTLLKDSIIVVKMLQESVAFAFSQLKGDKFRTFLSLFGVSIGIFSIVAIFSAIDALQENVRRGFDSLGSDVVQISKFPFAPEDDQGELSTSAEYKWWEYMRRPATSMQDYRFLQENSKTAGALAMAVFFNKTVKLNRNSISNCSVGAVTYDWDKVSKVELELGRYFSQEETSNGNPVGIIGYEVWQELFGGEDPLDKKIKVGNREIRIIGVFEKQGESMVNLIKTDEFVLLPLNYGRYMVNLRWADVSIFAKPMEGIEAQDFNDEMLMLMRSHRRIAPGAKNNFSINKMTFLMDSVSQVFSMINLAGWVIAGFSLLIGGFGIANIMFVSVKERTNIIGIQKALGAKKYVILTQFLVEAVFLAIAGGAIGILLVTGVILAIPATGMFTMHISLDNIISGLLIASVIGIVSGLVPAWVGATLNPVDAINSK